MDSQSTSPEHAIDHESSEESLDEESRVPQAAAPEATHPWGGSYAEGTLKCEYCMDTDAVVQMWYVKRALPGRVCEKKDKLCWACVASIMSAMPEIYCPVDLSSNEREQTTIVPIQFCDPVDGPEEVHPFKRHRTSSRFLDHPCFQCKEYMESWAVKFMDASSGLVKENTPVRVEHLCWYCTAILCLKFHTGQAVPVVSRHTFKDL